MLGQDTLITFSYNINRNWVVPRLTYLLNPIHAPLLLPRRTYADADRMRDCGSLVFVCGGFRSVKIGG